MGGSENPRILMWGMGGAAAVLPAATAARRSRTGAGCHHPDGRTRVEQEPGSEHRELEEFGGVLLHFRDQFLHVGQQLVGALVELVLRHQLSHRSLAALHLREQLLSPRSEVLQPFVEGGVGQLD